MASLVLISQLFIFSFGLFTTVMGLVGTIMQIYILSITSFYRKTPCTFYFIIGALHETGQFITAFSPRVIAAFLNIDLTHVSAIWCKLRYVFLATFSIIPLTFACLATIDQYLVTSPRVWCRQLSTMKNAYRASTIVVIFWWLHGTLWFYFQDMSPITGACIFINYSFFLYTVLFICIILSVVHVSILILFGVLAHQNLRSASTLTRIRADRQLTIIVLIQVLIISVGLLPYCTDVAYTFHTLNYSKTVDQIQIETLVNTITYFFGSITYGARFYLFMYASPRFRNLVKRRILWWKRAQRVMPVA